MRFELTINCNGAAFDPDPTHEVAALLLNAVAKLRDPARACSPIPLIDVNGNTVGWALFNNDDGTELPDRARLDQA